MSALVVLLEVTSCVGLGAIALWLLGIRDSLPWGERMVTAFVLGMGVLGWLMFFLGVAGMFNTGSVLALLAAGVFGLIVLGRPDAGRGKVYSSTEQLLLTGLALVLALDVLEGVSPPADADTMAYHFALPKMFWQEGQLIFVPRAIDGAIPLLLQMTYIPALGLGGEKALTMWTMVSGWGVAGALYFLCRFRLERSWSLVITLIWLTTPAVLYGGGSGQIEVRNAGFVIVALGALIRGRETELFRYAVLSGLAAGLFVGAKYTGLLFAAACGSGVLTLRQWPKQVLLFSLAALLAGFQWYAWNWMHTGDPVFPMLYGILNVGNSGFWDISHQQAMRDNLFVSEQGVPLSPLSALIYPFLATFSTSLAFDSERVGLGPFMMLILPFVLAGLWRFRRCLLASPLLTASLVVTLYYGLWFFSGSSQRVRHLLPIYPVALMLVAVAACHWASQAKATKPLMLACILTIGLQMAGHLASSINYFRYSFDDVSRADFLSRNISGYDAVVWINENLKQTDRVLVVNRQLIYLFDIPVYYAHTSNENFLDIRPHAFNPGLYFSQLRKLGITHILSTVIKVNEDIGSANQKGPSQWKTLLSLGCVKELTRTNSKAITSRSLAVYSSADLEQLILRVDGRSCPFDRAGPEHVSGKKD